MNRQISTYTDVDTLGRSQVELILKVYSGAQASLESAIAHYRNGDFADGYTDVETARKFVVHLYTTLDFSAGGEVATNLGRLYVYLLSEFDAIEATKNTAHLESCITVLRNLRTGWEGIRDREKKSATPAKAGGTTSREKRGRTVEMSA